MNNGLFMSSRITHVITIAFVMSVIVLSAVFGGWMMLLLACLCIAATGFLGVMSRKPALFIAAMLAWEIVAFFSSNTYFTVVFMRYYPLLRYVDDLLFLPPLLLLVGHAAYHRRVEGGPVMVAILLLLFVTVLSGLLHTSGVKSICSFILMYYRYFLVYIVIATFEKANSALYRRVFKAFVAVLVIQCLVNLFYAFNIPIFPNRFLGQPDDWAVGTMGLSSTMSYFALAILGVGVAGFASRGQHESRIPWGAICMTAVVLVAIAHSKHAIVPAAAQLAIIAFLTARRHPVRSVLLMLAGVVMLATVAEIYNRFYLDRGQSMYESRALEMASSSKVRIYENVTQTLNKENAWLLGMGPGNYSSVVAMWNKSPLFMQHFYAEIYIERYNPKSSIMLYPRTGVLSFLGDTGILGLLAYLAVLGVMVRRVIIQLAAGCYDASTVARALAIGWVGWVAFFLLLNVITDSLHYGLTPLLTFAWGGAVWNPPVTGASEDRADAMHGPFGEPQ